MDAVVQASIPDTASPDTAPDTAADSGYVRTPTFEKIIKAFDHAREPIPGQVGERREAHGIAMIYGASGAGKTVAADWYVREHTRKRAYDCWPVVMIRCMKGENSLSAMFKAIIKRMGLSEYVVKEKKPIDLIERHIPAGSLIIFDEAQSLPIRRLDDLRHFPDAMGIGIAFMGNMAGYRRLVEDGIAQITSRAAGARVVVPAPGPEDIDALLTAWNIRDREVRALALKIGIRDGGLRLLANTVATAKKAAEKRNIPLGGELFHAAAEHCGAVE